MLNSTTTIVIMPNRIKEEHPESIILIMISTLYRAFNDGMKMGLVSKREVTASVKLSMHIVDDFSGKSLHLRKKVDAPYLSDVE